MIRNHIVYNPILEFKFEIAKAHGSFIWTKDGKKVIDFTSGWNVANLGWNNPEILEAIKMQLEKNTYAPSWAEDVTQQTYAMALTNVLPKELNAICRTTSGTESNEQAIKIARTVTGKKKILGFNDTYHGSTYASISVGYKNEYIENLLPVVGDFIHMDFPEDNLKIFLEKLESLLAKNDVAAILCEAGMITGWGSMAVAPEGFLKEVKKRAEKHGALLILDEVGTGFSRCGSLFAFEQYGIVPDILTLAKAMTNGTSAMGACIVSETLIEEIIPKTKVLSSLAWMPLACAAANKSLEIHIRDSIAQKAKLHGTYLMEILTKIHPTMLVNVRGKGMEIGFDFHVSEKEVDNFNSTSTVVKKCFEKGLLLMQSDANTIQFMPPLTTPKNVLDDGLEILVESITEISK